MKSLREHLKPKGITINALADTLKVDRVTVWRWSQNRIPAERVKAVTAATGIPAHELRPDLFAVTQ
jgi:DNA-binding transcriptional regulator YdaS (Cro superfamily)